MPLVETAPSPQEVIARIRREVHGLDMEMTPETAIWARNARETISNAVQLLSDDLYSKQMHFVLELVQNADDNDYAQNQVPRLTFTLTSGVLTFSNNEIGFQAEQVRAICDVGKSTKKRRAGFIGEKGIGFKSVFTVSDQPEIHSNGFHFRFNRQGVADGMGCLVPHWHDPEPTLDPALTTIILPAKPSIVFDASTLADLDARLLLFLAKIQEIEVRGLDGTRIYACRHDGYGTHLTTTVQSAQGSGVINQTRFSRTVHEISMTDLAEEKRPGVKETTLVLAFPLDQDGRALPDQASPLFAFLPVRPFGFRFCVQGDFLLSTNREDLHVDKTWNQRLRDQIAPAFGKALTVFRQQPELSQTYLDYLPGKAELEAAFFQPVREQMVAVLREEASIPTALGPWRKPSEILLLVGKSKDLFSPTEIRDLFGMDLPHPDFKADRALLKELGCRPLTFQDLAGMFGNHEAWLRKKGKDWLAEFYVFLSSLSRSELVKIFRSYPVLPTRDESFVIPAQATIFFPLSIDQDYGFEDELTFIDADLVGKCRSLKEDSVSLFTDLGVRQDEPYDLVKGHILALHNQPCNDPSKRQARIGHIRYIKDKFDTFLAGAQAKGLNRDQAIAILTQGLRLFTKQRNQDDWMENRADQLYFGKEYAPDFAFERHCPAAVAPGNLVASDYLEWENSGKKMSVPTELSDPWRVFLKSIGVWEIPKLYVFTDSDRGCDKELKALLESPETSVRKATLECLDRNWAYYGKFTRWYGRIGRSKQWQDTMFAKAVKAMKAPTKGDHEVKLEACWLSTQDMRKAFGHSPIYVDGRLENTDLLQFLGIAHQPDTAACFKRLRQLRDMVEGDPRDVNGIYRQLERNCESDRVKIQTVFRGEHLIHVRGARPHWVQVEDAVWAPSSPFLDDLFPPLRAQYANLESFFLKHLGVAKELPMGKAIHALAFLDQVPSVKARTEEALKIYKRASRDLGRPGRSDPPPWVATLRTQPVLLDRSGARVSLAAGPMLDDRPDEGALFEGTEGVRFLAISLEDQPKVARLFETIGVPRLSASLTREVQDPGGGRPLHLLIARLQASIGSIARMAYYRSLDSFESARDEGRFASLARLEVVEVPEFLVKVGLRGAVRVQQGTLATADRRILVREGIRNVHFRLAAEICRILQMPENLADTVLTLLSADTGEDAEEILQVRGISRLPVEEEEALARTPQSPEPDKAPEPKAAGSTPPAPDPTPAPPETPKAKGGTPPTGPDHPVAATEQPFREFPTPPTGKSEPGQSSTPNGSREPVIRVAPATMSHGHGSAGGTKPDQTPAVSPVGATGQGPHTPTPGGASTSNVAKANGSGSASASPSKPTPAVVGTLTPPSPSSATYQHLRRRAMGRSRKGRLLSYGLSYADAPAGSETPSRPMDPELAARKMAIGRAAVDHFLETQTHRWAALEEMPHNNPGFDVRATTLDGQEEVVEVKGHGGAWTEEGVALTPTELICAHTRGEGYWLCVVEYALDPERRRLHLIRNPFGHTGQFRYDYKWKALSVVQARPALAPRVGLHVVLPGNGPGEILEVQVQGPFARIQVRLATGTEILCVFNPATMPLQEL